MWRFFAGVSVALLALPPAVYAQSTDTPELLPGESVVRVNAVAKVERMPDSFGITVTVETTGTTPREASEANRRKIAGLLALLRRQNISETTTKLEQYRASAIFDDDDRRRTRPIAYQSSQDIGIELASFEKVEPLVDQLTAAGFSDFRVGFGLKNARAVELDARRAAIVKAREEAANIAAALNKRVSRLLLVGTDLQRYSGNDISDSIVITGSANLPQIIRPAPIEIGSEVYADWSLVDR